MSHRTQEALVEHGAVCLVRVRVRARARVGARARVRAGAGDRARARAVVRLRVRARVRVGREERTAALGVAITSFITSLTDCVPRNTRKSAGPPG